MLIPEGLAMSLAYVAAGLALLILAKIAKDITTPFSIDEELTSNDNRALALSISGYYLGVTAIFVGAATGSDVEAATRLQAAAELGIDLAYAVGGIALLNVGRWLLDRLVLPRFSTRKEIIEDRNMGTGAVEAGAYLATALVVAGAAHGESGGALSTLAFFMAGQVALIVFAKLYDWITPYDLHEEIENDNVAAGVAFGGSMVAIGVVLLRATMEPYVGPAENASYFLPLVVIGFVALLVARFVTDRALLPKSSLSHEIATDRNLGAALVEVSAALSLAVVIFFMF